ncbi:MFS transporter [Catenulispora pinisilvae]|uniref:MFS transporter n=1 Tax=Catenulispora pinisilvae TaxID=2705253 RepID=UPI0018914648|nr:MFS transporter [Catenulispora pinisilvae]
MTTIETAEADPGPDLDRRSSFSRSSLIRRPLAPRSAYLLAAGIVGLAMFASGIPSPLYDTYSKLWGFSAVVLTIVYATYAFGVLVALLLAGRVSDEIGRRPVLLVALCGILVSTILYMPAQSVAWLYVARGLQGLATGLALSAASASLLDLHPRRDPISVGLANGVASAGGIGLGIFASSVLVQYLPAPRVLPYVLLAVLLLIATIATLRLQDPVTPRPGAGIRLTPQRPSVPPSGRRAFLLASLAVLSSWSLNGLYLSLGPELSANLLHSNSVVLSGLVVSSLPAAAALSQLVFGRGAPWAGASYGSLALAAGMGLLVVAVATGSGALFVVASVIAGFGFGAAFLGGLRSLSAAVPPEHRAAVMSAFYIVAYGALSLPAIAAGLLSTPLGLNRTFEIFGAAIAALALVVAGEAWRTRPASAVIASRQ